MVLIVVCGRTIGVVLIEAVDLNVVIASVVVRFHYGIVWICFDGYFRLRMRHLHG